MGASRLRWGSMQRRGGLEEREMSHTVTTTILAGNQLTTTVIFTTHQTVNHADGLLKLVQISLCCVLLAASRYGAEDLLGESKHIKITCYTQLTSKFSTSRS